MSSPDPEPEAEDRSPIESASKRRKRNDGSAEHSSGDERDQSPSSPQFEGRSLSIRNGRPPSRSRSRSAGSDDKKEEEEEEEEEGARQYDSYRSRSRSRSGSKSRQRSRSRSRSYSDSRSISRSRSRSRTSSSRRTPHRSSSTSPDRVQRKPLRPNFSPYLELRGHQKAISQVRISPDGRWIASASADGTAMIWDAETGAHMDTLVGHMAGVSCLAWSPDSETLATGSDDKAIRLWNRITGDPAHAVGADESLPPVGRIGTSARGIGGRTGDSGVRGSGGKKPLLGHHNYVYCLAFSPKGNILASGSYDEAVFLWDVRAGRLMRSLPAHSDPVSGIDFCVDGTLVASCSTDGLIRIWDTSTGQCLRTLVHEDNPAAASVCFSPNGRFVLASYTDSCMRLWDFINMPCAVKKTYQGHVNENFSIGGCFGVLRRHPNRDKLGYSTEEDYEEEQREDSEDDGSLTFVASASEEGDIVMWDVNTKEIVQRVEGAHQGVCFWVDVHGDSGTMVSCGKDGRIVVHKHRYPELQNGHANGGERYPEEAGEEYEDMQVAGGEGEVEGVGQGEDEGESNAEPAINGHGRHEGPGPNEEETPAARDDGDTTMDN